MTSGAQANSFFGVDLDLVNVGIEVRVNDIAIYEDRKAGQLTVELPCPDAILNGTNSLSVFAKPPKKGKEFLEDYEAGAYVSAKLFRQDNEAEKQYLATLKLQLNPEGQLVPVKESTLSDREAVYIDLGSKSASFTTYTKMESPFPVWAWQTGTKIENSKETYSSLLKAYREVYDALAANDQPLLRQLYSMRAEEIAIAYYLNSVDAGHEKISTGKDALNPKITLHEFFDKEILELQIFANGRLARLMTPSGIQPVVYMQKNPTLAHLHKFMFYKNEKNQWVMIR